MKKNKDKTLKNFDKYYYYHNSVQSPENDVKFFRDTYKELKSKGAITLREDFCGTFAICCEWVKLDETHQALGVDLDTEPIEYGRVHHLEELESKERERVHIYNDNVLTVQTPLTDLIVAQNFSYYIFKKRQQLVDYFRVAYEHLEKDGVFILDCFGGPQCEEPNEEETEHNGFSYYWDQDSFNPVTNEAQFYIHFKLKGKKKRKKVFSYDWRMWSIPELRDALADAGFSKTHIYWEQDGPDGDGNGEFDRVEKAEHCEAWVAYVVSEK